MSTCISWNFNFENDEAKRLQRIEIPFEFNALRTGYIHGLATWFDVGFMGQTFFNYFLNYNFKIFKEKQFIFQQLQQNL